MQVIQLYRPISESPSKLRHKAKSFGSNSPAIQSIPQAQAASKKNTGYTHTHPETLIWIFGKWWALENVSLVSNMALFWVSMLNFGGVKVVILKPDFCLRLLMLWSFQRRIKEFALVCRILFWKMQCTKHVHTKQSFIQPKSIRHMWLCPKRHTKTHSQSATAPCSIFSDTKCEATASAKAVKHQKASSRAMAQLSTAAVKFKPWV